MVKKFYYHWGPARLGSATLAKLALLVESNQDFAMGRNPNGEYKVHDKEHKTEVHQDLCPGLPVHSVELKFLKPRLHLHSCTSVAPGTVSWFSSGHLEHTDTSPEPVWFL